MMFRNAVLRSLCLWGLICVFGGVLPAEDAGVLLRFKFGADQKFVYTAVTKSKMETTFDGETEKVENSTTARKQYQVVGVQPDGSADLEVMFLSIKMRAKVADNPEEEFDSASEEEVDRVDFRKIKESVGNPQAVLRFSTSGKLDEIVKVEQSDATPHPDEFQTMLMTLPAEPVKVGTEWSELFKVRVVLEDGKLTQEISMSRKYKVESIEGDLVKISMRTAVLTPIRSPYIAVQLSQREMRGEILFDNNRGVILSRDLLASKEIVNGLGEKTLFRAETQHSEKLEEPGAEEKSSEKPSAESGTAEKPSSEAVK